MLLKLNKHIGKRISELRQGVGLSQEGLSILAGISRTSIVNIEKGRHQPSLQTLYSIIQHLETDITSVLPSIDAYQQMKDKVDVISEEIMKFGLESDQEEKLRSVIRGMKS